MAENLTIRVDAKTDQARRALKNLENSLEGVDGEMKDLIKETRKLEGSSKKGGVSLTKFAATAAAAQGALMLTAGAAKAFGSALSALGGGAIQTGSELELLENRLSTIMGSAEAAKQRFDELFAEASQSPFDVTSLVEADVTLQAFGLNSRELLGPLQDVAAVMGEDLPQAAQWMAKAFSQGASGMEGDTAKVVRQMVEMREGVSATEMSLTEFREALLETLTDPDGKFAGGAKKLVDTWKGAVSNLEDEWTRFTKDIADAGLFEGAKLTLRSILDLIDDNREAAHALAQIVSDSLVEGMLLAYQASGYIADGINLVIRFTLRLHEIWLVFNTSIKKANLAIREVLETLGVATNASGARIRSEIAALEQQIVSINEQQAALHASSDLHSQINEQVNEIRDALDALPDSIERTTVTVGTLTNAFKEAADEAKEVPEAFGDLGLDEEIDAFDDLTKAFGQLFPKEALSRGDELGLMLNSINDLLDQILLDDVVGELLGDKIGELLAMRDQIEAELSAIDVSPVVDDGAGVDAGAESQAGTIATGITDALTAGGQSLLAMIPGVAGEIAGAVFGLGQLLADEEGLNNLTALFEETFDVVTSLLTGLPKLIEALGPIVVEGVLEIIKAIPAALPAMIDALLSVVEEVLSGEFIADLTVAIIKLVPDLVKAVIKGFVAFYVELPILVAKAFFDLGVEFVNGIRELKGSVSRAVRGFVDDLRTDWKQALRDLWEGLKGVFSGLLEGLGEFLISLFPDFLQARARQITGIGQSSPEEEGRAPDMSGPRDPTSNRVDMSGFDTFSPTIEVVLSADAERLGFGLDPFIQQGIRQRRIKDINPDFVLRSPQTAAGI